MALDQQTLDNGEADLQTVSDVANGATDRPNPGQEAGTVTSRLGRVIRTLARVINDVAGSGGLRPYSTKAAMLASAPPYPGVAVVLNDPTPANNGAYTWDMATWTAAPQYYNAIANVVQPLVDDAEAARDLSRAYAVTSTNTPIPGAVSPSDRGAAYYAGVAGSAATAATAILTDPGFIAVSNNLLGPDTIGTVAANLSGTNTIGTVATSIGAVNTTATNIGAVSTVATNLNGPNTIGTVAGSIGAVNQVGPSIGSVNAVAGQITAVVTVATNVTYLPPVAADLALGTASTIRQAPSAAAQALSAASQAAASFADIQAMMAAITIPAGYYATHAAAVADVANIALNATVGVIQDEDQNGYFTTYKKTGSSTLTFVAKVLPPNYFYRTDMARTPNRNKVICWVGDSRTQARPNFRTSYETVLTALGCPLYGITSWNMGANGATCQAWVGRITTGDQSQVPFDYLPGSIPAGSSNPWQVVNADPDIIRLSLGTNDIRILGSAYTTFQSNLMKLVLFFLVHTRAKIILTVPAPLGYANPDPNGFTDCTSADDAAARSASMRQAHLVCAALPSNRIELHDTHRTVYGYRADSVAGCLDPEGTGNSLLGDTLHDSDWGTMRVIQNEARMFEPNLPKTVSHVNIPKTVLDAHVWGKEIRINGGGSTFLNVDNIPLRKRGDIYSGGSAGGTSGLEGNQAGLHKIAQMETLRASSNFADNREFDYIQQAYIYFYKTGVTIGPFNWGVGSDQPLNGNRQYIASGLPGGQDFTNANTGYSGDAVQERNNPTLGFLYVTERRYIPGAGETQFPLVIPINGRSVGPIRAYSVTADYTNGSNNLSVTTNTGSPLPVGSMIESSVSGLPADVYIVSVPVDGNGKPTATGTYKMDQNATATQSGATVTATASGAAKPQRSQGRPYLIRGVKGQRASPTGTAVIGLYAQTTSNGGGLLGSTPIAYPGRRLGSISFSSTLRSTNVWTVDTNSFPPVAVSAVASGGDGTGATFSVTAPGGIITAINVTNGGSGYTVAPTVVISGGGGTGAVATANISGGVVTSVTVNNGGSGYNTVAYPNGPFLSAGDDTTIVAILESGVLGRHASVSVTFGDS